MRLNCTTTTFNFQLLIIEIWKYITNKIHWDWPAVSEAIRSVDMAKAIYFYLASMKVVILLGKK